MTLTVVPVTGAVAYRLIRDWIDWPAGEGVPA